MRPILMKGHTRPLTQLKYNREGDLLFSTARDQYISVWYSENGERLGTLEGHNGAVFTIDVDPTSTVAATGASDLTVRFWTISNGQEIHQMAFESTPRFLELSPDAKQLLIVTERQMGQKGALIIYDVDLSSPSNLKVEEKAHYEFPQYEAIVQASWTYDCKHIVAGHRDGHISKIATETGEVLDHKQIHEQNITDLQMSPDRTYFVTSSRDKTVHLTYVDGLEMKKTYKGDVPLNSASITPVKDYIIAGGGMDARDVTTSSGGKFEAHFFHKLFEDDLGRLGGHFGPINTIAVHPFGTSYASGSEDGYIRMHHFDPAYFSFDYGKPTATAN